MESKPKSLMHTTKSKCFTVPKNENISVPIFKNPQNPGKEYFSIIAFSPEVTGIDEEGFSYSLKNGTLYNKESVGVSNEIMAKEATLRVKTGYLLVLITRD